MSALAAGRRVDYLVMGGGYGGLNALAGLKRARPSASVLCVDPRLQPGGSWGDYYPFVKLHAPHPQFGVSGHPWGIADPHTLATRAQVLEHFGSFVSSNLPPSFEFRAGHEVVGFERAHSGGVVARVRRAAGGDGPVEEVRVEAKHLINASGFNYKGHVSAATDQHSDGSTADLEISPAELLAALAEARGSRTYLIIGGGKTGIDTAVWLGEHKPVDASVVMVTGRSKAFFNRDQCLGRKEENHFFNMLTFGERVTEMSSNWNGRNGADLIEHYTKPPRRWLLALGEAPARHTVLGVLGENEKAAAEATCTRIVTNDHLKGVERTPTGSRVLLASGEGFDVRGELVWPTLYP
jgi:cation diffusion facilitator CzcD-associated flavoprotein CzcO